MYHVVPGSFFPVSLSLLLEFRFFFPFNFPFSSVETNEPIIDFSIVWIYLRKRIANTIIRSSSWALSLYLLFHSKKRIFSQLFVCAIVCTMIVNADNGRFHYFIIFFMPFSSISTLFAYSHCSPFKHCMNVITNRHPLAIAYTYTHKALTAIIVAYRMKILIDQLIILN